MTNEYIFCGALRRAYTMKSASHHPCERGVALITVVLMSTLVLGLIALVFTNSIVGNVVTTTHVQEKDNVECGHGNIEMAEDMFLFLATQGQAGLPVLDNEAEVIATTTDLITELNVGFGTATELLATTSQGTTTPLDQDTATTTPDFTIVSDYSPEKPTNTTRMRDCQTNVDIDFLYAREPSEPGEQINGYRDTVVGPMCDDGVVYSIDTVSNNPRTNATTRLRSAYYKCPD